MSAPLTTQRALNGRLQTLVRIALLQARAAEMLQCPWAEATVWLSLTAVVQRLVQENLLAFSHRPQHLTLSEAENPNRWLIRVTSRGYDALPEHVRAMLALQGLTE